MLLKQYLKDFWGENMSLYERIRKHEIVFGVIGIGYVGLAMSIVLARKNRVVAYDIDSNKIELLQSGKSYIDGIFDSDVLKCVSNRNLYPTNSDDKLNKVDCFIVCVPTPLMACKQPEIKYLVNASKVVSKYLHKDTVVIIESTTYPGTTEELIKPILEDSGFVCGQDFYLAFSPERIDPGNKEFGLENTPKIVGGTTEIAGKVASLIYRENLNCEVLTVSSPRVAEMAKILENAYRNVNIGLINEFAMICHKMNIDIWEVIESAKTKPFGFQAFYPGPGVGGHCIPVDPYYWSWKVREYNTTATIVEASEKIIEQLPDYTALRIIEMLNHYGKSVRDSRILILGIAYKANISDCRESPAIAVMKTLLNKKAQVDYYDPYVPECLVDHKWMSSINFDTAILSDYDMIVVLTGHDNVDYMRLTNVDVPVFDTRNILKETQAPNICRL